MAEHEEPTFLTERRALGLIGATVLATVAYEVGTNIDIGPQGVAFTGISFGLSTVLFFFIFIAVFSLLNYAVWKYD